MATVLELDAQIESIDAALNRGERRISYDGQSVEYDLAVLEKRRAALVLERDALLGIGRRSRGLYPVIGRGY